MVTNKFCVIIFILAIISIIFLIWLIFPYFIEKDKDKTSENIEKFTKEKLCTPENIERKQEQMSHMNDIKIGTIIDGPGCEKGEFEGISEQPSSINIPPNYYFLDDGADGEMSLQHNLCSKSCCSE